MSNKSPKAARKTSSVKPDEGLIPSANANPKGHKVASKTVKVARHKLPERRNENKVRGR